MFSTARLRLAVLLVGGLLSASLAAAQSPPANVTFYRVFLNDGTTLVSYGEFSRVGDKVIVSMPVGGSPQSPDLQMVSLAAGAVDWQKTDAYADAARAARYAVTQGPTDFALLSEAVTVALNDIAATTDPARKVAMATEARQNVMRWSADHFGYQADRVAELAQMFDQVVAAARAGQGEEHFDLAMVAGRAAPPAEPLLPEPTLREELEQAVNAAAIAPDPTERVALLRTIVSNLGDVHDTWSGSLKARASGLLASELATDAAYARLSSDTLKTADADAKNGLVLGIERLLHQTLVRDDRLGRRRPGEMAALLATLDARLDAARKMRLAQDQWAARVELVRRYRRSTDAAVSLLRGAQPSLDAIRTLAGPSAPALTRLSEQMGRASAALASLTVPAEGVETNGLLKSAAQLAARAADERQRAVAAGDMQMAWEAASAASGAMMLFTRAAEDLRHLSAPPIPAPTKVIPRIP